MFTQLSKHQAARALATSGLFLTMALMTSGCPEECEKGSKDCACKDDKSCNSGLSCKDDKCVASTPACPDGSEGCPCYANDTCDELDGVLMLCESGVCVADTSCPVGTQGCPCNAGVCQSGLTCSSADVCEGVTIEDGISVGEASVRACDLLFDVGATGAEKVVFDASVIGKFRKEGSRIALSFAARQDAALTGPVAQVQDGADTAVDISAITPSTSTCYDRLGAAVSNPQLVLR